MRGSTSANQSAFWRAVKSAWIAFAFAAWFTVSADQSLPEGPTGLNFRRILPQDGLPAAEVRGLLQDRTGFIWVGTYDGLVRYDGARMRTFRHNSQDPGSLANNVVWNILEDGAGNLWLATWGGLDRWDRRTEKFEHHRYAAADPTTISDDVVRILVAGDKGTFWVGTSKGLNHFDPATGKFRRFEKGPGSVGGLSDDSIRSVFRDSEGIVWVGTDAGGLNRVDPQTGTVTVFTANPASPVVLPSNFVSSITEDHEGNLWVGTDQGVARLDIRRNSITRFPYDPRIAGGLPARYVETLFTDRDGRLWVGTDRGGLSWFNRSTETFTSLLPNPLDDTTLATDVVRLVYQDLAGDYWIGHFPYGISYASRLASAVRHQPGPISTPDPETKREVNGVWEDPNGDLWIATNRGLERTAKATGTTTRFRHDPNDPGSLASDTVQAVFRDSSGRLWIGAFNGGLSLFNERTGIFKTYLPDPSQAKSLPNPHVWRIAEDSDRNIWVATRGGGLAKLLPDGSGFEIFQNDPADPESLNHNLVWFVLPAKDGSLWAGTTRGIGHLPRGSRKWQRYQHREEDPQSLSNNYIVALYEDSLGQIWAAAEGGGLNRLDPRTGKCRAYTMADGMPSDQARGIVPEDENILWILTNNGLARFDRRTERFQNFSEGEGLNSRLIFRGAGIMSRDGELIIGTAKGINIVSPRKLMPNTNLPPVALTSFEIANREVTPGGSDSPLRESITVAREVRISSHQAVLTFNYAALNFRSPEANRYSYKLESFDEDWSVPDARRQATYTGLSPGTYIFRVTAANNDGFWNRQGAQIRLVVLPTWWQTVWFQGGALLLAAGTLAFAGSWLSNKRLMEQVATALRERALAEERQRASEERESVLRSLREAQNRYRELLDNADVGICILQDGRIKQPNKRLATLLSQSVPTLEGMELRPHIYLKDLERFDLALRHDPSRDDAHHQAFRLAGGAGNETWVEMNSTSVLWEDRPATLVLLTDVSSRVMAENRTRVLQQQLHQSQRLESLGTLAGGIAHDFNNILGAILGYAELAKQDSAGNTILHESIEEILRGGKRARDLVQQILLFSRRQKTERRPIRLQPVVQEVLKLLKSTLPASLEVVSQIAEDAPVVLGDSSQIHQVLINLCTNAAHAMRGRAGKMEVRLDAVIVDAALAGTAPGLKIGAYCRLTVADNGHGMDEATQKRIFEPFFTMKKPGEGTGLGLSVVHGIVQDHDGVIKVYSEIGKGTVFTVFLPAIPAIAETESARRATPRGNGESILLVDDEPAICKVAETMLVRAGYRVTAMTNPQETFNRFHASPSEFDLVITDLSMPGMTGVELAVRIHQVRPTIPILLASGFNDVWTEEKLKSLGLKGLLMKPFDSFSLVEKVHSILGQSIPNDHQI